MAVYLRYTHTGMWEYVNILCIYIVHVCLCLQGRRNGGGIWGRWSGGQPGWTDCQDQGLQGHWVRGRRRQGTSVYSRVDKESRFAIFLARISWKMRLASRENISVSLANLTSLVRREKCDILWSLRVSQLARLASSKILIHSEKLVLDPKFLQDSTDKISNDSRKSRYKISNCETWEKRVLLWNFFLRDSQEAILAVKFLSVRVARSESRY